MNSKRCFFFKCKKENSEILWWLFVQHGIFYSFGRNAKWCIFRTLKNTTSVAKIFQLKGCFSKLYSKLSLFVIFMKLKIIHHSICKDEWCIQKLFVNRHFREKQCIFTDRCSEVVERVTPGLESSTLIFHDAFKINFVKYQVYRKGKFASTVTFL